MGASKDMHTLLEKNWQGIKQAIGLRIAGADALLFAWNAVRSNARSWQYWRWCCSTGRASSSVLFP
jgi:hypothetical protein